MTTRRTTNRVLGSGLILGLLATLQAAASELPSVDLKPVDLRATPLETTASQRPSWLTGSRAALRRVDAGVEDLNVLSHSLRHLETGLGQPRGFEDVYEVPGHEELLMRASGALHAVFPQSVYTSYRGREIPLIPASTVFQIGELPKPAPAPPLTEDRHAASSAPWTPIHSGTRVYPMDERSLPELQELRPIDAMPSQATILSDVDYRRSRMAELMRRAADAEVGRQAVAEPR